MVKIQVSGCVGERAVLKYLPSTLSEVKSSESRGGDSLRGVGLKDRAATTSLHYTSHRKFIMLKSVNYQAKPSTIGSTLRKTRLCNA